MLPLLFHTSSKHEIEIGHFLPDSKDMCTSHSNTHTERRMMQPSRTTPRRLRRRRGCANSDGTWATASDPKASALEASDCQPRSMAPPETTTKRQLQCNMITTTR